MQYKIEGECYRIEMIRINEVVCFGYFFFNDTATTEIYTLSLHDALPISVVATDSSRSRYEDLRGQPRHGKLWESPYVL